MKAKMKKEELCNNCSELAIKDGFCISCFERIAEEYHQQDEADRAFNKPTPIDNIGYSDEF